MYILTLRRKNLRSALPRLHHRRRETPRPRIRYVSTPRSKNLRSALPRPHHRRPGTSRPRMNTLRHLDAKTYEARFLYSIIGDFIHEDHALDTFRHQDTTTFRVHYLDAIIGHRAHTSCIGYVPTCRREKLLCSQAIYGQIYGVFIFEFENKTFFI